MYKSLPKLEKTFTIDLVGETTGLEYKGQFTAKCVLSIRDRQAIELEKSRLTADYANPSGTLFAIASMVATLRAKLVEFPDWWKEVGLGSDLLDENVLIEVYEKTEDIAKEWKESLKKQAGEEKDKEGNEKKGK